MFCPNLNIRIEMCYVSELGSQSSSCPHCWSLLGPWICQLPHPTPGLMAVFSSICDSYDKGNNFLNFTTSLKTGDWYLHLQPHPLSWPRKHKNCWRVARYHRQVISNQPKWKNCTYFRFPGWSREPPMRTRHWRRSQRLFEEDDWHNMEHSG